MLSDSDVLFGIIDKVSKSYGGLSTNQKNKTKKFNNHGELLSSLYERLIDLDQDN